MARRLAVISSHLRPTPPSTDPSSSSNSISRAPCDGCGSGNEAEEAACIFCKIVRGESTAFKLYEDDLCLCILDSYPLTCGHSLIIPRSHFSSLEVTPPGVIAGMCSRVPFLVKAIMKATGSDSFNLLVNSGAVAGQVIFHTHLHLIPRRRDDDLWTTKSIKRKALKAGQEAAAMANLIREQLSSPLKTVECSGSQDPKIGETSQT